MLKPVLARYQGKVSRIYFRADAGFANPEVYEFLEAERIKYAIRLPANRVLQDRIGYLLKRPVGRPPNEMRRFHANFFIVTSLSRPAERVVAFYNRRGTCEQWIKEGKGDQVDAAVVPDVRRQRGAAPASRACLQPRQFPPHSGDAGADQGLVADEPEGEADQNRRKGREP